MDYPSLVANNFYEWNEWKNIATQHSSPIFQLGKYLAIEFSFSHFWFTCTFVHYNHPLHYILQPKILGNSWEILIFRILTPFIFCTIIYSYELSKIYMWYCIIMNFISILLSTEDTVTYCIRPDKIFPTKVIFRYLRNPNTVIMLCHLLNIPISDDIDHFYCCLRPHRLLSGYLNFSIHNQFFQNWELLHTFGKSGYCRFYKKPNWD